MIEPVGAGGRGRVADGARVAVSGIVSRVAVGGTVGVTGVAVKVRVTVGVDVAGRVGVLDGIGVGGIGVDVGVGGAPHAIAKLAIIARKNRIRIL